MLMQTVGLVVASYLLVCFKSTRSIGLIGFALLLFFRPLVFLFLAVTTAAALAFICRRAFKFDHLCALNFDQG